MWDQFKRIRGWAYRMTVNIDGYTFRVVVYKGTIVAGIVVAFLIGLFFTFRALTGT